MSKPRQPAELTTNKPPLSLGEGSLSELQGHYTDRLRRLLQLRREHLGDLNEDGVRLLDRSIFATYCDCVEVGAGMAAQDLLRSLPYPSASGRALAGSSRRRRRK